MPVNALLPGAPGRTLRLALLALAALVAALLAAQPARANAVCSLSEQPVALSFGGSQAAIGTIRFTCRNFDPVPVSFTLCAGVGTSNFPGTADQPKLQGPNGRTIDYNLYVDPAATRRWTRTTPITLPIGLVAGGTASGTLTFYGRIATGQPAPTGNYQGFLFNTTLGFLAAGSQICVPNLGQLNGLDFTVNVGAVVAQACSLGSIAPLDFGTPPGIWQEADAAASVQIVCPVGTSWTLRFDGGLHPVGGERRMRSALGEHIPYRLYRDSGRSQPIPIDGTMSGSGTGAVQANPVYGRAWIPQLPRAGEYTDAVIVVLSF